jgi:hypothetical protein
MNDWIDQIKNVFCVKEREREREYQIRRER